LHKPHFLIAIDDKLISDEVVQKHFVCDLSICKGGCCVDGDAGAPLEKSELQHINDNFEKVKPYLHPEGLAEIERSGRYRYDREFGWVTPTLGTKICVYGYRDKAGIVKCAFEQAYYDGVIEWKKPISCHLYPIRIKKGREYEYVNYEPREELCAGGCSLGDKLKVPAYVFLKESIIRKYGQEFYDALDEIAKTYF